MFIMCGILTAVQDSFSLVDDGCVLGAQADSNCQVNQLSTEDSAYGALVW
jgi:hypothetical protein